MDLLTRMDRLGGVASWAQLLEWHEPSEILVAADAGTLIRTRKGRYALPTADAARRAAHQLSAVVGLRSAAAAWGWALKTQPERAEIIVPRGRKVPAELQRAYAVRWRRLPDRDIADWRTTPLRTVIDCARALPVDEALAVADSALRSGLVDQQELILAAGRSPGRGRERAERIAWAASAKPAGPFESVIRGISLDVAGLRLRPQVRLTVAGRLIRPDLVDERLRLVVEGDSHEFHTSREAIDNDCWRYDELVLDDWLVLRVSWVQAMFHQQWVRSVLARAVVRQRHLLPAGLAVMRGLRAAATGDGA